MQSSYKSLALMMAINFLIMFALNYAMVSSSAHIYLNVNYLYMTLMMLAPMLILMLLVMASMYRNKKLNYALHGIGLVVFASAFAFGRAQSFVGKAQFLRSMIPHHSSAILMCEKSAVSDPDITKLCGEIVESQKREIAEMKNILDRM